MSSSSPYYRSRAISPSRTASPTTERLDRIKNSVSSLASQLRFDHETKESLQQTSTALLQEMCLKNDQNLALEIERRSESDKALKQMFTDAVNSIEGQLSSLRAAIDVITHRVGVLEGELRDDSTRTKHALQETVAVFDEKILKLQNIIEMERASRQEFENSVTRLTAIVNTLEGSIRNEESTRHASIDRLSSDLDREARNREDRERLLESYINDQVSMVRSEVRVEREDRELSEEEIVRTINEVVRDIKEGLRIVSS